LASVGARQSALVKARLKGCNFTLASSGGCRLKLRSDWELVDHVRRYQCACRHSPSLPQRLFVPPFRHSLRVSRLDREASTSTVAVPGRIVIVRNCGGRASTKRS